METVLNVKLNEIHFQFAFLHLEGFSSLVPRPSTPLVFDHFLVCKNGERPWEFHHVIRSTADVTDSIKFQMHTSYSGYCSHYQHRAHYDRQVCRVIVKQSFENNGIFSCSLATSVQDFHIQNSHGSAVHRRRTRARVHLSALC